MNKLRVIAIALIFLFCLCIPIFSEARSENIDCIVLLDKSFSMSGQFIKGIKKIEQAREFVAKNVVDDILIAGDSFTLIAFYSKTEILFSGIMKDESDRQKIMSIARGVQANGVYTDIANALDSLKGVLSGMENNGKKKYILLVTDEKQEVPKGWKYYSANGKINHYFLKYTRRVDMGSYRVITIGAGFDEEVSKESGLIMETLLDVPSRKAIETGEPISSANTSGETVSSVQNSLPIGIVLAVVGGVLVIAFIAILLFARARKKRREQDEAKQKIEATKNPR